MTTRAALYLRVSTRKQAEQDLSIPDQRSQLRAHCKARGWQVVEEYVEPGASATTTDRPVFQRMLSDARQRPLPFDVILVHSYSRFARDLIDSEFTIRLLAKQGVRLISITQEVNDSSTEGQFTRQIMQLMDEYQSKEIAKHTLRAMEENARQGFWNGSHAPFGFKVVDAEKRGHKTKKKLAIHNGEAATVRDVFRLYLSGTGRSGPMGIKNIVTHLNGRSRRQRNGKPFGIQFVHKVLRNTAYIGTHYFNRKDSKGKQQKARDKWIGISCPPLIDRAAFQAVQKRLSERNPKKNPTRTVTNAILLSGLVKCGSCGGAMTLRAGKSGRYRYYACSGRARVGATRCKGNVLPMPKLDNLVTDTLLERVLAPERVAELVREVRRDEKRAHGGLATQLREASARERELLSGIDRLLKAIEDGLATDRVKDPIRSLEASLEEARETKRNLERRRTSNERTVTPQEITRTVAYLGKLLRDGELELRKAYLRLFIDTVEVADGQIIITGSKRALAKAVEMTAQKPSDSVPVYMRDWRARQDSNLRPPA